MKSMTNSEPKPTPSTPARIGSVAAYIGITEDQIKRFVGAMNMVGLEIVETSSRPQHDSSSIPEQTFEEWWTKFNADVSPTYRFYKSDFLAAWNAAKGLK